MLRERKEDRLRRSSGAFERFYHALNESIFLQISDARFLTGHEATYKYHKFRRFKMKAILNGHIEMGEILNGNVIVFLSWIMAFTKEFT